MPLKYTLDDSYHGGFGGGLDCERSDAVGYVHAERHERVEQVRNDCRTDQL